MKRLFIDVETTFQKTDGKRSDPSPYNEKNYLVSAGFIKDQNKKVIEKFYGFYRHDEGGDPVWTKAKVQAALDWADQIIAFNSKFDVAWLLETGHECHDLPIADPMVTEYVLARGQKWPLDLDSCLVRRNCGRKHTGPDEYLSRGIGFEAMPKEVVSTYGMRDVETLRDLFYAQEEILQLEANAGLLPTVRMSGEFVWCLIDMERNGIRISAEALDAVEREYDAEYHQLKETLERLAKEAMGDTPINLNSPEQMSQLIYSRKVLDKNRWADIFNIGMEQRGAVMKPKRRPRMSPTEFVHHVRGNTKIIRRTRAEHCVACDGRGLVHKKRMDGSDFKRPSRCRDCDGNGYRLVDLPEIAGFGLSPSGPDDVTAGGFATDGESLERLVAVARGAAEEFLTKLVRFNAVDVYRSTFIGGIRRGMRNDGLLHTNLMQCITATGRLSSQNPNFQNMPRGNTFPIRRVVVSRWENGNILEVDFSKLEYVTAVFLAQDKVGLDDILNDVDAHSLTRDVLVAAGQSIDRQGAKPHTFKPLYGGSSGTPAEQEYYQWFKEKHQGIAEYQERSKEQVLRTGILTLPSGRQYMFVGTKRLPNGWVTNSTQICNYPVQGFATGDIVPCCIIDLRKALKNAIRLRGLHSRIILTVHDSIVFDVYPGEEIIIRDLVNSVFSKLGASLYTRYGFVFNVPLGWETKLGPSWFHMKEYYKDDGKKHVFKL